MFNPVIILAIIVQGITAQASRLAGAIVGYLITTGILIWGISIYSEGGYITFFGIKLLQPIFFLACLVWYGFDTKEFIKARKESLVVEKVLKSPLLQDHRVVRFYQKTMKEWASNKLSNLNASFEQESRMYYGEFIKSYLPFEGNALYVFFSQFPPLESEFLVGTGDSDSANDSAWFVLTNMRLIQKNGRDNSFNELNLGEIDSFEIKPEFTKTMVFKLKSGQIIDFENVDIYPSEEYLSEMIKSAVAT